MNKLWYTSKTLWLNVIAIVGVVVWGKELDATTVATVLVVLNVILRFLTKKEIVWAEK